MALYALGVGAATNPTDDKDLQLVFALTVDDGRGESASDEVSILVLGDDTLEPNRPPKSPAGLNVVPDAVVIPAPTDIDARTESASEAANSSASRGVSPWYA